jgi:hypothetical protein
MQIGRKLSKAMLPPVVAILVAGYLVGPAAAAEPTVAPRLTCVCRADNDLFAALGQSGYAVGRADDPAAGVAAAAPGSGLLVLADDYPAAGPAVPADLLAAAAAKQLKVFIEYPTALAGLEVGKARAAGPERAVVTDDFFGDALPAGRILAVQGLHFVPIAAAEPHLVAARVAGFDTAVYGLPAAAHPLLFEAQPGAGPPLLVATTAFSRFVRGRYAPADGWRAAWGAVLRWLDPAGPHRPLEWTPVVRPSYSKAAPLPPEAEREAIRRGAGWFLKSKLLVSPERLAEVERVRDGHLATPPPDAPVGDGSLGILEAPLSVIGPDGRQIQSAVRRGDCHAEAAMALALAAAVLDDPAKGRIARNLLDFYLFQTDAQKRERGDPNHGAYGLVAWGISSPAWYVANYGDDNARFLLGALATAAVLDEPRWNESLAKCLLGNLRTTGRLGFRTDRIDIPALSHQGWRPFFDAAPVNPAPHFEAYLWACYLAADRASGFEPFVTRSRRGIRRTMATGPDGWIWTNGIAQEKARILLPLAWLVRHDDTPEHRALLRRAVESLVALQDESGAIREELGVPGRGKFPAPPSNEAYGHGEASLIQENGDPVADMLYTSNFAFLGLHEAAAAGDELAAKAADKLAGFLCRIQLTSDADPSLDGGWFRAFDFDRWEAWGSNADAGWGAWAIESGWTQGWIVAVLAMRSLDTSLWDLAAKVEIGPDLSRLRPEMIPDDVLQEAGEGPPLVHAARGKKITLVAGPAPQYATGDLVDGAVGIAAHGDSAWLGIEHADFDAVIDLGAPVPITEVVVHALQHDRMGIALPNEVEVWVGDDAARLALVGSATAPAITGHPGVATIAVRPAAPVTSRFVRLRAPRAAQWTFVSEVAVNPAAAEPKRDP